MSQPDELVGVDLTSIGEIDICSQIWLRTSFCNDRPFALADCGFMVLYIDRDVPFRFYFFWRLLLVPGREDKVEAVLCLDAH